LAVGWTIGLTVGGAAGPVRISAGILAEALRRSLASWCNRESSRLMSWRSEGLGS
jgi:hypothetical protein